MIELMISSAAGRLLVEAAHTHVLNLMTPICLSQSMSVHAAHMTFIKVI